MLHGNFIIRSIILVKTNQVDGDYLAAYFTASKEIDKDDLTKHMSKSLTPYMIPKVMMQLDKIPLTPNGKIDKKALPEIEVKKEEKKIKKASNELEEKLLKIFAKALGQAEIGIDDDFFDLGGTSLSASKVAMLALKENLPIAYKDIFEYSTVSELEKYINSLNGDVSDVKNEDTIEFDALKYNNVKYIDEIKEEYSLGNVLLTGATGFLGIHIFKELLNMEKNMYLLIRSKGINARKRLEGLLAYYFDDPLTELIDKYVTIIDADIIDTDLENKLNDIQLDTIINCAAIVKHFSFDDIIEKVNVGGVNNLINISLAKKARLILDMLSFFSDL